MEDFLYHVCAAEVGGAPGSSGPGLLPVSCLCMGPHSGHTLMSGPASAPGKDAPFRAGRRPLAAHPRPPACCASFSPLRAVTSSFMSPLQCRLFQEEVSDCRGVLLPSAHGAMSLEMAFQVGQEWSGGSVSPRPDPHLLEPLCGPALKQSTFSVGRREPQFGKRALPSSLCLESHK